MNRKIVWWICLGVLVLAPLAVTQAASPEVTRCDDLMASEDDPNRFVGLIWTATLKDSELLDEAVRICKLALTDDPDNPRLQYQYGLAKASAEKGRSSPVTGVSYIRRSAEAGYLPAQFSLARIYNRGLFGEEDVEEAIRWYEIAADQGYPYAHFRLGMIFTDSAHRDIPRAVHNFEVAARAELPGAMMLLALHLFELNSDEMVDFENSENLNRAVALLEKATESGMEPAAKYLGEFYGYQAKIKEERGQTDAATKMQKRQIYWRCRAGVSNFADFGIDREAAEARCQKLRVW